MQPDAKEEALHKAYWEDGTIAAAEYVRRLRPFGEAAANGIKSRNRARGFRYVVYWRSR